MIGGFFSLSFFIYSWKKSRCLTSLDEEFRVSITIKAMLKGRVSNVKLRSVGGVLVRMIGSGAENGLSVVIFSFTHGKRADV